MITFDLFEDANPDRNNIRDVATKAAIIKARMAHPSASNDTEALAKDMIDTQARDEQEIKQAQEINNRQDELLQQIRKLDSRQDREIDDIESDENSLEKQLQNLRLANEKLTSTIANMRNRKKSNEDLTHGLEEEVDEARANDVNFGSGYTPDPWIVYDKANPNKIKKFKTREGAKAYAEKTGCGYASFGHYVDHVKPQPVNELDKSTLADYVRKAAPDRYNRIPNDLMKMKDADKNRRQWVTRDKGIDQALTKLSKEGMAEGDTFNRGGHNPLRDRADYADKRAHLFDLLSHAGMAPEDKQFIRQRLLDLDIAARKQGFEK